MKIILMYICLFALLGCGGEIKSALPKTIPGEQQEKLSIDVFELTFHKQLGTCATLPITHRMLTFAPILIEEVSGNFFIGVLDVILDKQTGTYKALYREFPNEVNTDQTQFQIVLNGNFEIIKAATDLTNDKMILENIGVISPTIRSNTVSFALELDQAINRSLYRTDVSGRVISSSTSLIDDNCLL